MVYLLEMVIFYSYVKLPEGNTSPKAEIRDLLGSWFPPIHPFFLLLKFPQIKE